MSIFRNIIILFLISLLFRPCVIAQRYLQSVFTSVEKTINVKYGSAINYRGAQEDLLLDIFQPEGDTISRRPLIIFIHGGGFIGGNKEHFGIVELCTNFAKRGYVTTSIDYRLDQSITSMVIMNAMHDARAAVRFFKRYASVYGIDTNKIVMGGGSAGASTSLCVSYINKQSELLPGANPNNIEGNSGNPGFNSNVQACIDLWGALVHTSAMEFSNDPPLIIIHGTNDQTVLYKNAIDLDARANQVGLYHEFYPIQGAGHGPWSEMTMIAAKTAQFLYLVLIQSTTEIKRNVGSDNEFILDQNYPNPFNPGTVISYTVATQHVVSVQLKVYDMLGKEVTTLVNEEKSAGKYDIQFDATGLPSGIYFYQLREVDPSLSHKSDYIETKKMVFMK